MSFFKDMVKDINDENVHLLEDGGNSSEFTGWIDTGSYMINALCSGSLFGGIPNNKILGLAGEEATGKTYFALGMVENFMRQNQEAGCLYYDTESAVTKEMMLLRGIDPKRMIVSEPSTVQQFRYMALQVLKNYREAKNPPPMMMVLDSMGQLSTSKEIEDTEKGSETKDMSRAALLKGAFRVLNLNLAKCQVPMIVTNHVYDKIGCLDGEQNIIMSDGTTKNIKDIAVGDLVKTLEGPKLVSELFQYDVDEIYEIKLSDNKVIKCTPNHKFMTKTGEWKRADELSDGDELAEF